MKHIGKIICLFMILSAGAQAQSGPQAKHKPLRYSSLHQLGLLTGGSGQSFLVQTIHGVAFNNWFTGLGTGIDYYGTRSVPLFVAVQHNLGRPAGLPFAYANGGLNFSWATDQQKFEKGYQGDAETSTCFDVGLGWDIKLKNNTALVLSAGYSYKQTREQTDGFSIWSWPSPEPSYQHYNYEYRRIVLKLGLRL